MTDVLSSGVPELDSILAGGFPRNRLILVEGEPGTGKTTLAFQFLLEGIRAKETVLYVAFSESSEELQGAAESHGWTLQGINILDVNGLGEKFKAADQYTVFHPSEVELTETTQRVMDEVNRVKPTRLVLDSLSEIRLLAREPLRYRHQILALKELLSGCQCTVLFLEDRTTGEDLLLQSIAHGVLSLHREQSEYGGNRRRLQVVKMRGVDFLDGFHDFVIRRGGLRVYPRLVAAKFPPAAGSFEKGGFLSTGNRDLDSMIGGGVPWGAGVLIAGPAGTGKSTLAAHVAHSATSAGFRVSAYLFEELRSTFLDRARALGLDLDSHLANGKLNLEQIDPAELSPGEFAYNIRRRVDKENSRVVIIDSLNGYQNAMPSERFLLIHMHELLSFLNSRGVITVLISSQHGIVGTSEVTSLELTYLSDLVIFLRYFEAAGRVRQAISILKNRKAAQERILREFEITSQGIHVGLPLNEFRGILTGVPVFEGRSGDLMKDDVK